MALSIIRLKFNVGDFLFLNFKSLRKVQILKIKDKYNKDK